MNIGLKKGLGAVIAAVFVATSAAVTLASEPGNNSFTPSGNQVFGDWEVLVSTHTNDIYAIVSGTMNSNSDVDYILVNCGYRGRSHIRRIKLGDTAGANNPLPGDYDVYIYDPSSGSAIASGTVGGTTAETVEMSALGRGTVVAQVVRYTGALGNYGLRVECEP